MKKCLLILTCVVALSSYLDGQDSAAYHQEILDYRAELNREFKDSSESPLPDENIPNFEGLEFFPVDPGFRIAAQLIRTPESKPFEMPTSTERMARYRRFGLAVFTHDSVTDTLEVYQNLRLQNMEEYRDYLFIPFNDLTNGFDTYGGGRYLDTRVPEGDTLVIDFNKCYNPYCAYNSRYSCPIPPKANFLNMAIRAGVKNYHKEP